jgi:hypothetical protein
MYIWINLLHSTLMNFTQVQIITESLATFQYVRDLILHPYKTTGINVVLYILIFRILFTREQSEDTELNFLNLICF